MDIQALIVILLAAAAKLIEGIEAAALLADRAYDTNEILEKCEAEPDRV